MWAERESSLADPHGGPAATDFVKFLILVTPKFFFVCLILFAMASQFFYSSLEDLHLAAWATPTFASSSTMTQEVAQLSVATTHVKLCSYCMGMAYF